MTATLRSTAKNPVAIALMGLLILVFLILGVGGGGRFPDALRGARADSVVSAGGHVMTGPEYRRVFEQQKQQYEQQSKQQLSTQYLVQNGFDQQLLSQIALDQGQAEMLARAGLVPDPSLIDAQIKQIPAAFDRVTGKFSEKQFTEFLGSQGLTPRQVQVELTDELAQRHFALALAAGFKAPRAYAAMSAIAALQNRDVSYFLLDSQAVVQPAPPTDAQLLTFMKVNASQLTRPEMRTITLVRFSASDLASAVTVTDADVQKEFAFRKDTLSTPETRSIIEIPVKSADDGARAAQRLAKGEDPASVAKAFGAAPVLYSDKPRSAIPDVKIAAAAFALKVDQTSGPVQGDLGLAAIKVTSINPAKVATLEAARAKIEADLKAKAAQKKAYEMSQAYDDARQGGAGLVAAAQKAAAQTLSIGPFTAEGADALGKPNPVLNDKIVKSAFAMRAGEESDVQDAGTGEYFALKVEKVAPPALPPLNEVRPQLTQAYMREQLILTLRAKSEALMAELKAGKPMDQVAGAVGGHVIHETGMQLIQAQRYSALGREFLSSIFGQKPGEVFAAGAPTGFYIARLDAIRPGDITTTARFLESVREKASGDYLRDLLTATKSAAEKEVKVNINLALARQTMGIDPASVAAPGAKGAAKAK